MLINESHRTQHCLLLHNIALLILQFFPKVFYGSFEAFFEWDAWLPIECRPRSGYVRFSSLRVVFDCGHLKNFIFSTHQVTNNHCELFNWVFLRVPEVNWLTKMEKTVIFNNSSCYAWLSHDLPIIRIHQSNETINQITDVLEWSCLLPITINCKRLAFQCLLNKIANDSSVVHVHSRSVSIKNPSDSHIHFLLLSISIAQCLSDPFAFIIASSGSDGVHMPPISLWLWMHIWVTINFWCALNKEEDKVWRQTNHLSTFTDKLTAMSILAPTLRASPSMLIVPSVLVLMVFTGLYM